MLSRQDLPILTPTPAPRASRKGAYVLRDADERGGRRDVVGTGSEVDGDRRGELLAERGT